MTTETQPAPNWTPIPQDGTNSVARDQMRKYFENFPMDLQDYEMRGDASGVEVRARDGSQGFFLTDDRLKVLAAIREYEGQKLLTCNQFINYGSPPMSGFQWMRRR